MDRIVWAACTDDPNVWMKNLECHPGFAAYLQVVGVIVAILGTALITYWATKTALKPTLVERQRRAKVLVYRLLPGVADIVSTCARVRLIYQQTERGSLLANVQPTEQAVWAVRIDAQIPVEALSEMHVLDEGTAETVARLHYYLSRYNEFVRLNVPMLSALDGEGRTRFEETFDTLLSTVEHLAREANSQLLRAREH